MHLAARRPALPLLVLLLVVAAALTLAPAALSSPGWTAASPFPLPLGETIGSAQVGYADGGTATVAYVETTSAPGVLHAGTVAPGEGYDEQLQLAAPAGAAFGPISLSESPNGSALLAYALTDGSGTTYLAVYRSAGAAAWTSPTNVGADPPGSSGSPRVVTAIAPDGTAAVAVDHPDPALAAPAERVDVTTFSPAGAAGPPAQLDAGAGTSADGVTLGFDSGDHLTAVYESGGALQTQVWSGGGWAAPAQIAGSTAPPPFLAVAPDGTAVVAYAPAGGGAVQLVERTGPGGGWSAPLTVGAPSSTPAAVALAPDDTAYVLFDDASDGCAGVARVSSGAVSGACVPSSAGGLVAGGISFVGSDAYLGWSPTAGPGAAAVQATGWPSSAPMPAPATALSAPTAGVQLAGVAADGDGGVGVFWTVGGGLRAAAFDTGGPLLLAADIPQQLPALQVAAFSATFADLWSGVADVHWSFGDGSDAQRGAQAAHAFARSGSYPVTVSATDALANSTSQTFTVAVGPPAPRLSRVAQSARRWRPRHGTVFRFSLSRSAVVTFSFRPARGGRVLGTLTVNGRRGPNRVRFAGRLSTAQQLPPGRYRVTLVATSAGESSGGKSLTFSILPAR